MLNKETVTVCCPAQRGIVTLALAWRGQKEHTEKEHDKKMVFIEKNIARYLACEKKARKRRRYYLGDEYPGVYFTTQEARCMFYFLKETNRRILAKILRVVPNTLTDYAKKMCKKLGCAGKKTLVLWVRETDFMDYFAELEAEETEKLKRRKKLAALLAALL